MDDFVTFEIAKKLEEKGFNYKCLYVYNKEQIINPEIVKEFGNLSDDGYYELTKEGGGELDWDLVYINEFQLMQYRDVIVLKEIVKAPTISQVLKWLREEKEIDIAIYPIDANTVFMGGEKYILSIYINRKRYYKIHHDKIDKYVQWEEAALAGIEYVLNNLIM